MTSLWHHCIQEKLIVLINLQVPGFQMGNISTFLLMLLASHHTGLEADMSHRKCLYSMSRNFVSLQWLPVVTRYKGDFCSYSMRTMEQIILDTYGRIIEYHECNNFCKLLLKLIYEKVCPILLILIQISPQAVNLNNTI